MVELKVAGVTLVRQHDQIVDTIQGIFGQLLGISLSEADHERTFLELGLDSLMLLQASSVIQEKFGLKISFHLLLDELSTIPALAAYVGQHAPLELADTLPAEPSPAPAPAVATNGHANGHTNGHAASQAATVEPPALPLPQPAPRPAGEPAGETSLERLVSQQLNLMSQQLELLRNKRLAQPQGGTAARQPEAAAAPASPAARQPEALPTPEPATPAVKVPQAKAKRAEFVAYQPVNKGNRGGLTSQQQQHLAALSERYVQRTAGSKRYTQEHRPHLADNRVIAGFRLLWKDLCYPIVIERGAGSHMWDIDGNEYVDLTMGFGTLIFGHTPPFITEALEQELRRGMRLGPQSALAGEVARLIGELTGNERVVFCNSGTEAVMTAMRLARTATGRNLIAMFPGSFHGSFDGTLVRGETDADGTLRPVPMAPGVPRGLVQDTLLLPYDSPESIELVRTHGHQLAAVLIEPTRSRHPDVQPVEFLRQLRQVCDETGTALIFDEIVTGFRLHQGGAQAHYGVQADIVTYGKALTGGIPIGVIGGKARFLNGIDGGMWQYGDDSYPQAETTFFAGTFCKHPLAMAAARAALGHYKQQGPQLQEQLTARTAQLTAALNQVFTSAEAPIRAIHCGSLFRFQHEPDFRFMEIFFFHMVERGIYIWEGRNCFLSTAHTEADLELVVRAVRESVEELRAGGFLPPARLHRDDNRDDNNSGQERAPAIPLAARLPLTDAQRNLWSVTQIGTDASSAYNQSITLTVRGPLHLEALRAAFQQVVNRHEGLRTTFSQDGSYQEVLPSLTLNIPLIDFSGEPPERREQQVDGWLRAETCQPFDLVHGPLLRAAVIKTAPELHFVVLTIHHLIIDGKAMGTLLTEVCDIYGALATGGTTQLPPPVQFREYAAWLAAPEQQAATAAAKDYWRARFQDAIPVLELPTDRPRPAVQTFAGDRVRMVMPPEMRAGLQRLGAKRGCTLYVTLLAGLQAWLHRLTGQTEVVVGVPVSGQMAMGADRLVGYCLNMLPVLSHLPGNPTFEAYLKGVKQALLEAQQYQSYPFGQLVTQFGLQRDPSRPPLIAVTFNVDMSSGKLDMAGLDVDIAINATHAAAFDFSLNITDNGQQLTADCDYNTDLFDAATVERFMHQFQTLLASAVADPQQPVRMLPMLPPAERQQVLAGWNATTASYPHDQTLAALFAAQAARTPEAVAVALPDAADSARVVASYSYRELDQRANRLAHLLIERGLRPDTPVAVCLERSPDLIVALLAILKAGGAYLPLDPAYPAERQALMLADARSPFVITHSALLPSLPATQVQPLVLDTLAAQIDAMPASAPDCLASPDQLAYILYTSGSTGTPKGVAVPHRAVVRLVHATSYARFGPDQTFLLLAPLSFDAATLELWGALLHGSRLVLFPHRHPEPASIAAVLRAQNITTLWLTAGLFHLMVDTELEALAGVRQLLAGGDVLSVAHVQRVLSSLPDTLLINGYGPTENTTFSTCHTIRAPLGPGSIPIGRPIGHSQAYVLDDQMQPVPVGVVGELYVGGDGLARGYWQRPDLTAERFVPNPFEGGGVRDWGRGASERSEIPSPQPPAPSPRLYKTGDLARWLPDGTLEFIGRRDGQVKLRGFRIEPGEIEYALVQHPAIASAVVHAWGQAAHDKQLVGYVVPKPGATSPAGSELRAFLKSRLPDYMVPAQYVALEQLPLNSNGKIDRKALPAPDQQPAEQGAYLAPRTPVEASLAAIWEEVLGCARISVDANFFDLGGHSLLAVQITTRIRECFQIELNLREIFETPTIADLALRIIDTELDNIDPELLAGLLEELEPVG